MTDIAADVLEADVTEAPGLWPGDAGTLTERSRRALLELVRGPYLSRARSAQNWSALLADEPAIRSRLNDLFLELVLDRDAEFAFVRNAESTDVQVPRAVRAESLTFLDTAMLLSLRHTLLNEDRHGRVIIGQDELYEALDVYRTADRDATDFRKRLNASWSKMVNKLRVLHPIGEDRAEISPVVRMLVGAEQVDALQAVYDAIAEGSD
ncbi:MAG: hypothetical protein BGN97_05275 [Microbacterium sp. 69-10]|uniref:DUF4194 domain-containing protein n=1 Tax=Microbacterium sp. 69-10 TaxID=1895783 RepID=UPI0009665874|nr:DUF4194 domain-containing protein [Microbacterium sp. 69-10]OJU40720.1 MAG: hypothetical protein BGN97_05275 [Microbacterium sp. 69-10]